MPSARYRSETPSLADDDTTVGASEHKRPAMDFVRRFKDPIHDYMPFGSLVCSIIDTKQFQRLRHVKQLGTSYYVWPGACHNRFEHCLGVAFLAQLMTQHLQQSQPELGISDHEVECVTIAGLCHDLGHGPWSHVWDSLFIPKALPDKKWKHEDASEMMFDSLVQENGIPIDENDATFIKALIAGDPGRCKGTTKRFLFDIVANKRNGLDVDKFDYIARDSHAINQHGNLSLSRLIHSARVIDDQICYDIKDANQVYELCYTRFSLHKRIYNHKTAKAIEYMIIDALLAAEPHMKFASQIFDPERYTYLTDHIQLDIESSTSPALAESRAILNRVRKRELYKLVDYKVFEWSYVDICREYFTAEKIVKAAKELFAAGSKAQNGEAVDPEAVAALDAKHVIVDHCPMHYGMQDKNPLDFVRFYTKRNPNKCQKAGPGDISLLMPACFAEVLVRVYTRDSQYFGLIQAGYRAILETMPGYTPELPDGEVPDIPEEDLTPTPPATQVPTEAPSTPPPRSRAPLSRKTSGRFPDGSLGSVTPGSFSANPFTKVDPNFRPTSPSLETRQARGAKRAREAEERSRSPPKKKRSS